MSYDREKGGLPENSERGSLQVYKPEGDVEALSTDLN